MNAHEGIDLLIEEVMILGYLDKVKINGSTA